MKRMILCFSFSPGEKTNLQEEDNELYFELNTLTYKIRDRLGKVLTKY